jgi:hypothetical protein
MFHILKKERDECPISTLDFLGYPFLKTLKQTNRNTRVTNNKLCTGFRLYGHFNQEYQITKIYPTICSFIIKHNDVMTIQPKSHVPSPDFTLYSTHFSEAKNLKTNSKIIVQMNGSRELTSTDIQGYK